jgi:hypothetical protein
VAGVGLSTRCPPWPPTAASTASWPHRAHTAAAAARRGGGGRAPVGRRGGLRAVGQPFRLADHQAVTGVDLDECLLPHFMLTASGGVIERIR